MFIAHKTVTLYVTGDKSWSLSTRTKNTQTPATSWCTGAGIAQSVSRGATGRAVRVRLPARARDICHSTASRPALWSIRPSIVYPG